MEFSRTRRTLLAASALPALALPAFAWAQGSNCTVSDGITRATPDRAQPSLMIRLSSICTGTAASHFRTGRRGTAGRPRNRPRRREFGHRDGRKRL